MARYTLADVATLCTRGCWVGRGEYEAEKARQSTSRLSTQLAVHKTRLKQHTDQRDALAREVRVCARQDRARAKALLAEKRKLDAKVQRASELCDFLERTIESVSDASSVRETLGLLSEVRTSFRNVDMEHMYSQLGDVTGGIADFNQTVADAQELLAEPIAPVATRAGGMRAGGGTGAGAIDDAELEAELEEFLAADLPPAPAIGEPAWEGRAEHAKPARQLAAVPAGTAIATPSTYTATGLFA